VKHFRIELRGLPGNRKIRSVVLVPGWREQNGKMNKRFKPSRPRHPDNKQRPGWARYHWKRVMQLQ
jgi:hypothetical protein